MIRETLESELLDAVTGHDVEGVRQCLQQGADPDATAPPGDGYDQSVPQPDTPLKAVVFCMSDAFLDEQGLADFKLITGLLLAHGADPEPALAMARQRYGKFDKKAPRNTFMEILYMIVAAASRGD